MAGEGGKNANTIALERFSVTFSNIDRTFSGCFYVDTLSWRIAH
jgi:hypothetical protein